MFCIAGLTWRETSKSLNGKTHLTSKKPGNLRIRFRKTEKLQSFEETSSKRHPELVSRPPIISRVISCYPEFISELFRDPLVIKQKWIKDPQLRGVEYKAAPDTANFFKSRETGFRSDRK